MAVARLKSIDNGETNWQDSSLPEIIKNPTKMEKVLGHLKFNYFLFIKIFPREPLNLYDFFDGLNFIYFYSEKGGMV